MEEQYDPRDWSFNSAAREWLNSRTGLTLRHNLLGNNSANSSTSAVQHLVSHYASFLLPRGREMDDGVDEVTKMKAAYLNLIGK